MSGCQESAQDKSSALTARAESGTSQKAVGIATKKQEEPLCKRQLTRRVLALEKVNELFKYEPSTGTLFNRCNRRRARKGEVAGTLNNYGYLVVKVSSSTFLVHRLIWAIVYGYFPENQIDHINRNKTDNRIENLREVSDSCNKRNKSNSVANSSGVNGVGYDKSRKSWMAYININNRAVNLARSKDFIEAVAYRLAAEQCCDWPECNSLSSAYQLMQSYLKENQCT